MESLLPLIKYFAATTIQDKKRKSAKMLPPLSVDVALAEYDVFDDYLEMVIQFGVREPIGSLFVVLKLSVRTMLGMPSKLTSIN